jgi:FMN phosphatase YigB (HAD superfamily)
MISVGGSMRVLYYLEPWIELDHPHFRLGSIRNHIGPEISVLLAGGHQVSILLGEAVAKAALRAGLLPSGLQVHAVPLAQLHAIEPNYAVAARLIEDEALDAERLYRLSRLMRSCAAGSSPDVVIAYESAGRFLKHTFPEAALLHSTLGIFSREPYPETFCLDPCGTFRKSWLAREGRALVARGTTPAQREFMAALRRHYLDGIMRRRTQFTRQEVRGRFERCVMLALQVSPYYAFDGAFPMVGTTPAGSGFASQFDFLCWTMERIPRDIGVFVTEHGYQPAITSRNEDWLRTRYPNLMFDPRSRTVRWASQHALQHVDGVVTVSSSVGLQAAFAGKHLCAVGSSHLSPFADCTDPAEFGQRLETPALDRDGALHHLLTRYYPHVDRHIRDAAWYGAFLRRSVAAFSEGRLDGSILEPIEEEGTLLHAYLAGDREALLTKPRAAAPAVKSKQSPTPKRAASAKPTPPRVGLEEARAAISRAEVVSFDIFDTLLTRRYDRPETVWDLVALDGAPILGRSKRVLGTAFPEARRTAGARALAAARARGAEDTTLREIYSELRRMLELSRDDTAALRRMELKIEFNALRRRPSVFKLYRHALASGKRVFFTSDMYLDKDFVEHVLKANGLHERTALLLSSDRGRLKKTGALFDVLIAEAGVAPSAILHIGDNPVSDRDRAVEKGISSMLISTPLAALEQNRRHATPLGARSSSPWASVTRGLVAAELFDSIDLRFPSESSFDGSAYRLGFAAGGPIVLQFAAWVLQQARMDGTELLCFLSRDGYYPKLAYDLLAKDLPGAPRAIYLRASRRACVAATLTSPAAVMETLELAFSATSVGELLEARFGLGHGEVAAEDLLAAGFSSAEEVVSSSDSSAMARLRVLLGNLSERLITATSEERQIYREYLRSQGLFDGSRMAVVDLGHNGTLQRALARITTAKPGGYYYATFATARSLEHEGLTARGCLLHFEDRARSKHYYPRSIGMHEFLFLPPEPSFLRMRQGPDGIPVPEFVGLPEPEREKVAHEVERGIRAFLAEAHKALGPKLPFFKLHPEEAGRLFAEFVDRPTIEDASIVRRVAFADAFGGNPTRPLIAPWPTAKALADPDTFVSASWWRQGARTCLTEMMSESAEPPSIAHAARLELGRVLRKLRKLLRKPVRIVLDSRLLRLARGDGVSPLPVKPAVPQPIKKEK